MKDYDAIVRADWDSIDVQIRQYLRNATREIAESAGLKVGAIAAPAGTVSVYRAEIELLDAAYPEIDHAAIASILKESGIPDEAVEPVCKAITPARDLEKLWADGWPYAKLQLAVKMKNNLNDFLKHTTGLIVHSVAMKTFPGIVVNSLQDAVESAKAYVKLLDSEIQQNGGLRTDNKTQFTTKHHPAWKQIYSAVVRIIIEYHSYYGSKSPYSMTARLMAAAYPWYWGHEHISQEKASEHIRKGCTR